MTLEIPNGAEELTADWLSAVLERPVSSVDLTRIGQDEGFTGGGIFRLTLDGDQTLIAKLSPEDPKLRDAFFRANAREVAFYQFSRGHALPVPKCYFGGTDEKTGASALLIEDMGACRSVDFRTGCGADDVAPVVDALAQIHAEFWDSAEIGHLDPLALQDEFDFNRIWSMYPDAVRQLLPDVALTDRILDLGAFLADDPRGVFGNLMEQNPLTCVHRDAQVDNVLFDGPRAILLDWQFMGRGLGVHDLSFFLISSLPVAQRRACEDAMIERYHATLMRGGINGYSLAQCQRDYKTGVVGRLFVTGVATTMLDNSDPHKRAWRRADLERLLAFCADHAISPDDFTALAKG